jgi:hypothetical protein
LVLRKPRFLTGVCRAIVFLNNKETKEQSRMRRDAAAAGELVARASSPAGSGGVPPRERSLNLSGLAAGRRGNPPPGRLRYGVFFNSRPFAQFADEPENPQPSTFNPQPSVFKI